MGKIITVPEFILHDGLQKIVKFIREDYKSFSTTPDKSYIVKLVKELGFERYNYDVQAVATFLADEESPKHLTIDLGFNMKRETLPAIHITMPAETPGQNALGLDEGSRETYQNYTDAETPVVETLQSIFTRRYRSTYDIVIVSDNSNEVVMIYHIVKALLVSLSAHFTLSGLENFTFGGQDLQPYAELAPKNIFMRAIRLGLEYESSALDFEKHPLVVDIVFANKVVNE